MCIEVLILLLYSPHNFFFFCVTLNISVRIDSTVSVLQIYTFILCANREVFWNLLLLHIA